MTEPRRLTVAEILPAINAGFERRVTDLATDGRHLAKSYQTMTAHMLRFAKQIAELWKEARDFDKGEDGQHQKLISDKLADIVPDATAMSQWVQIGTHAKELLKHRQSLPPSRDSLYQLALALKEKRPIQKWIESEKLSTTSTVREVRALRGPRKAKLGTSVPAEVKKQYNARITICCHTFDDLAAIVDATIDDHDFAVIYDNIAFLSAAQEALGASKLNTYRARIVAKKDATRKKTS